MVDIEKETWSSPKSLSVNNWRFRKCIVVHHDQISRRQIGSLKTDPKHTAPLRNVVNGWPAPHGSWEGPQRGAWEPVAALLRVLAATAAGEGRALVFAAVDASVPPVLARKFAFALRIKSEVDSLNILLRIESN